MRAKTSALVALVVLGSAAALVALGGTGRAQAPIGAFGTPVTQNFDTLASTGTSDVLPTGWAILETGTGTSVDQKYAAYDGSGGTGTGNTYSAGTTGSTDRALGTLQSGTNISSFGAHFTNSTGGTISSLTITYTGENWRVGTADRLDRIDFAYSLDATGLADGAWVDVDALDHDNSECTTPPNGGPCADDGPTGAKNGNTDLFRATHTATITGLSVAPGASLWIRWTDFNASGSDDLLAVDDFSLTAEGVPADQAFALRRSLAVAGGYRVVGNVILDCAINPCPAGNNGTPFVYVDADDDDTTAGSSAATLELPAGATPEAAYLLVTVNGTLQTGASPRWADTLTTANVSAKLRGPSDSDYALLAPDHVSIDDTGTAYQGLYDVTAAVKAQGPGEYWLADPTIYPDTESFNAVGNWILIVVYDLPGEPLRLVNIYDGLEQCFRSSFDVQLAGFETRSVGEVTGLLTIAAGDGSASPAGVDSVTIGSLSVSNALNPQSNIANNTVSGVDGVAFPRDPSSFNVTDELVDIDTFDISGALGNNATSAEVSFSCTDDGVVWHGLVLAFDIEAPSLTVTKTATPVDGDPVLPGALVDYAIDVSNDASSVENARLVTVTDPLPAGVGVSATTFTVSDGTTPTTLTTALDGDAGEIVDGVVTVRIGALAIGQHRVISFQAEVAQDASGAVANTAFVSYRGVSSDAPILGRSNEASIDVVGCGPEGCVGEALVIVFFDSDEDGFPNGGDIGLANWIIDIGEDQNVTDSGGFAFFGSADLGTQPFGVTPPDDGVTWIFDAPASVEIVRDNQTIFLVPVGCSCDDNNTCTTDSCFAGECGFEPVEPTGGPDATCDGVDDDCDGETDEDWVSEPDVCGEGPCGNEGATTCTRGVPGTTCVPLEPTGSDDNCDGFDDDCDGTADDEFVGVADVCGEGVCRSTGTTTCVEGEPGTTCTQGPTTGTDNDCDGLDDNCDGLTDNHFAAVPTTCGRGVCASTGVSTCVLGVPGTTCIEGLPTGTDTNCNGSDEDCDGTADDGFVGGTVTCGVGECAGTGTVACVGGKLDAQTCVPVADETSCDGGPCAEAAECRSGVCTPTRILSCDDADPCTDDACDPSIGCVHPLSEDGTPCDDKDKCTAASTCEQGFCGGPSLTCAAPGPCEGLGQCNPSTGVCDYPFDEGCNPCAEADEGAPVITCPDAVTIECAAGGAEVELGQASARDACSKVEVIDDRPGVFPAGPTIVTFTATDAAGNVATCTTTVTVEDNVAPTFFCPEITQVEGDPGTCGALVTHVPSATDACGEVTIVGPPADTFYAPGQTPAHYVAVDAAGNQTECDTIIEVTGLDGLSIDCEAEITVAAPPDVCGWPEAISAEVIDECRSRAEVQSKSDFFAIGESTVTFDATADGIGEAPDRTAHCETVLTVEDVTPPLVRCGIGPGVHDLPAVAVPEASDACGVTLTVGEVTCTRDGVPSSDRCEASVEGNVVTVEDAPEPDGAPVTATWTVHAVDPSGNVADVQCDLEVDPTSLDHDHDGIPDRDDNCPVNPNTDQRDTDFDDIGDVCDEDVASGLEALGSGGCAGGETGGGPAGFGFLMVLGAVAIVLRRRTIRS